MKSVARLSIAVLCLWSCKATAPEPLDDTGSATEGLSSDEDSGNGTEVSSDHETDSLTDSSSEIVIPDLSLEEIEKGWVTVPAGNFTYGSPLTQPCRGNYSEAQVDVIISRPFKMASTETTRKQWRMTGFPDPSKSETCDDCPQDYINWYDVLAWLNALSKAADLEECYDLSDCTGTPSSGCPDGDWYAEYCVYYEGTKEPLPDLFECSNVHKYPKRIDCPGYRLPTEAEWEWAARGGTTTATYNGELTHPYTACEDEPVMDPIGWYCGNTGASLQRTAQLRPNEFGLYDMLGNAFEWVDGIYTGAGLLENNGGEAPLTDPVGETSEAESKFRSLRGGSRGLPACRCTASTNMYDYGQIRSIGEGFRPVRTIFE